MSWKIEGFGFYCRRPRLVVTGAMGGRDESAARATVAPPRKENVCRGT
jgi:hypothetical protein